LQRSLHFLSDRKDLVTPPCSLHFLSDRKILVTPPALDTASK